MQPEIKVRLELEATVSPSEDRDKLETALKTIVPAGEVWSAKGGRSLRMESSTARDLEHLRDQLRDRQVRAAARRFMVVAMDGNRTTLLFNRQAAAAGVVALCGNARESPLGPIVLKLDSEKLEDLMEWLAGYPSG